MENLFFKMASLDGQNLQTLFKDPLDKQNWMLNWNLMLFWCSSVIVAAEVIWLKKNIVREQSESKNGEIAHRDWA